MEGDLCRTCGGDGRIGNSLGGSNARCPSCHGTGRRAEAAYGFHDVTKTKPEHHRTAATSAPAGPKVPITAEGIQLAREVNGGALPADAKARLVAEIANHESTHGRCTKTFLKKVRKQLRPGSPE
jgi:hypothetical protein